MTANNGRRLPGRIVTLNEKKVIVLKKRKLTTLQLQKYMEKKERVKKLLELKLAGATHRQVLDANIGYKHMTDISRDLKRAYEEAPLEAANELVLEHIRILRELYSISYIKMKQDLDLSIIPLLVKLLREIRDLAGVDTEVIKQNTNGNGNIQNNGVIVVTSESNGTEYLQSLMQAANAKPEEVQRQIQMIEARKEKPVEQNVVIEQIDENEEISSENRQIRIKLKSHEVNEDSTIVKPGRRELNRIDEKLIEDAEIIDVEVYEEVI